MKRSLLFAFFIFQSFWMYSQQYEFTLDSREFKYLENPVVLSDPFDIWYGDSWHVPLPFAFNFYGHSFASEIELWDGSIYFNDDLYVDGFGADLIDRNWHSDTTTLDYSPISYQVLGEPGDRKLVFEYKEAGFNDGDINDKISFQIWLYEYNNAIEIHIGPNTVNPEVYQPNGWDGPYIGINNHLDNYFLFVDGDPLNPVLYTADDSNNGLIGTPPNGTVYSFRPTVTSVNDYWANSNAEVNIYPNPASDFVNIDVEKKPSCSSVEIFDLHGKKISEQTNTNRIDLDGLNSGTFILRLTIDKKVYHKKLTINN